MTWRIVPFLNSDIFKSQSSRKRKKVLARANEMSSKHKYWREYWSNQRRSRMGPGSRMRLTGRKPLVLKFGRVPRLPLEKAAGNRFIGRRWYIASIFKCYIIGLSQNSPIVISRQLKICVEGNPYYGLSLKNGYQLISQKEILCILYVRDG